MEVTIQSIDIWIITKEVKVLSLSLSLYTLL